MTQYIIEENYPLTFRKTDASELGRHLKSRNSVVLVGMKKVGISNFLRFFLNNKDIPGTYIKDYRKHFFVSVDLNDLIECEVAPFWTLTLKRIVDNIEKLQIDEKLKLQISDLFLQSIQLQDLLFTIDNVRKALNIITEQGFLPSIFFIRFDRMQNSVTPEFFANLEGLKAANQHLAFIFTSFQPLKKLIPNVLPKTSWSVFFKNIYVKPAKKDDVRVILNTYKKRYTVNISDDLENDLLDIVDGYTQYLQLALIILHERNTQLNIKKELFNVLFTDERVAMQSEELWESIGRQAQEVLVKIVSKATIFPEDKKRNIYLWNTGLVNTIGQSNAVFSELFERFITSKDISNVNKEATEFSKKENLLFNFLKENINEICEREEIVNAVWPEEEDLGVSDWAIDKLVARVRNKLKNQTNSFEIQTIKTRGYKLIEA